MRESVPTWQTLLAEGFKSAKSIREYLKLPMDESCELAEQQFKTRVPKGFVDRMQPGNINDPLLKQVLAQTQELDEVKGYTNDPLAEQSFNPVPGLIHKYHGRVLITLTGTCAINCRYCFRRHFPYSANHYRTHMKEIIDYLSQDSSISEVIFSGGDPLLVSDNQLQSVVDAFNQIPSIQRLRWHSRVPIVLPQRITPEFLAVLASFKGKLVMVTHCNHPQEIDASVAHACELMQRAKITLLNQSVLLAHINDCADTLSALSNRLFDINVMPYYLHLLDKVKGAHHFDMPRKKALTIYQQLQKKLPGYLVPKLVEEIPGIAHKSFILK